MVAAYPLVVIFILAVNRVNLFAELTEKVARIVFIAVLAEKTILVLFHSRTDFFEDFF